MNFLIKFCKDSEKDSENYSFDIKYVDEERAQIAKTNTQIDLQFNFALNRIRKPGSFAPVTYSPRVVSSLFYKM